VITVDFDAVTWRKSSHSGQEGGTCVELADVSAAWRKSSHSGQEGGPCIELADVTTSVAVRDSKNPGGPKLLFTRHELRTLAAHIKSNTLDS
jgi:hypothetical protein